MIRRSAAALTAAALVFAACVAGSLLYRAHVVASVDGTSLWSALRHRLRIVLTAWHLSMEASDWLRYAALALAAGALVFGGPFFIRLARSLRGRE